MARTLQDYQNLPSKRMAAGALVLKDGKALLVEPTYKDSFEIPGGIVERDESPREALIREIKEELGLEVLPGRLLVTEYQRGDDNKTESLMFVFEVHIDVKDESKIVLNGEELRSWRFVEKSKWQEKVVARLARRLDLACAALEQGRTVYVEDGTVVG